MNFNLINKFPRIKNRLLSQVGYYSDGMYSFSNDALIVTSIADVALVIVAKKHYVESWQTFASINKNDLKKVIKLRNSNQTKLRQIFQIFENKSIDGYDVKTTTFEKTLSATVSDKKILLPETELYKKTSVEQHVYQIEALSGTLFCGGHATKSMSSYAKGMLQNIDTYMLSVGLPEKTATTLVSQANFASFLQTQLLSAPINKIISQFSVRPKAWLNQKQLHVLYWAPLLVTLVFYLLSNSYLYAQTKSIENELASGGAETAQLLANKRDYDKKLALVTAMSMEFKERQLVHYYWSIINHLLDNDMTITRMSYTNGKLVIRGGADKASDVLNAISTYESIESVSFEGPVRKSRGIDTFILNITPKNSSLDSAKVKESSLENALAEVVL